MNLFIELYRHGRLAEKRHPMYEKSRFAKFWIYFMAIFWAGYLIFFGTMMGTLPSEDMGTEPYHLINSGLIFFLGMDFLIRFPFQKTPSQEMKPYLLLPIRRRRLIDFLLIRSGLNPFNLIWLFFFIPFALLTITKFYGLWGVITYSVGIWLLMIINNYWFLLCRTLMSERLWWVAVPIAAYGTIAAGLFLPEESPLYEWSINIGEGFITGNALTFLSTIIIIILAWGINRSVIQRFVYNELNKVEDTTVKVKNISDYRFLDRYGEIGEYIRLELKLMLRNKMCRKSLYSVIVAEAFIVLLLCINTTGYSTYMQDFFTLYNYVLFGILFLSNLMGYEGNYIDGLMSRKESIFALLRAKYILYSIAQIIPTIVLIPAIILGQVSILTCLSWMFFVPGVVYFCMFQLAVYNNKTTDLNTKISSRQNMGTGLQNIISFVAFLLPLILNAILNMAFDPSISAWILMGAGIIFMLLSPWWLRNVYVRFMKRRYINMEGFRDSRQK